MSALVRCAAREVNKLEEDSTLEGRHSSHKTTHQCCRENETEVFVFIYCNANHFSAVRTISRLLDTCSSDGKLTIALQQKLSVSTFLVKQI